MSKSGKVQSAQNPTARPRKVEERANTQDLQGNTERVESVHLRRSKSDKRGWFSFFRTALRNLQLGGMLGRYLEARRVEKNIESGGSPKGLGLDPKDYRLRNVAEMSEVGSEVKGKVDRPAAHSLRDANFWFYTVFGNRSGSFEGMDMERYREIGAMPGKEAAEILPHFEAETFKCTQDPETIEFGNSLPERQRRDLFMLHNRVLSPRATEQK